jgi:hypothetical protein
VFNVKGQASLHTIDSGSGILTIEIADMSFVRSFKNERLSFIFVVSQHPCWRPDTMGSRASRIHYLCPHSTARTGLWIIATVIRQRSMDTYPNFGIRFRYVSFKESCTSQEQSFSLNIFGISSSRREEMSYSMRLDRAGVVNPNLEVFGAEMQNVSTDFLHSTVERKTICNIRDLIRQAQRDASTIEWGDGSYHILQYVPLVCQMRSCPP